MTPSLLTALLLPVAFAQGAPDEPGEATGDSGAPTGEATEGAPSDLDILAPPALLTSLDPVFPADQPPEERAVSLLLAIDASGEVVGVEVSAGAPPFDALAAELALGLRFTPALWRGEPTAVQLPFQITFTPPPVNLSGVLSLAVSEDPIQGALVTVGSFSAETDAEGRFELRGLPPGEHTLRVLSPALVERQVRFSLAEGERVEMEVWARPAGATMEALGVYRRRDAEVRVYKLDADAARTTPGSMGDPVRAIQNLPGMVHTPLEAGWLLVRGGAPEDTGVFIDGIQVPLIYHMGGLNSVVHPGLIASVEYTPGGYNPRYGRANAGAVDLKTKPLEPETRAEVGVDLLNASGLVQVPVGESGALALAARRSYLDRVIAAAVDEETARIAPRFSDWQVLWRQGEAAVHALGYNDFIDAPVDDEGDVLTYNVGTQRVHGRYRFDLGGDGGASRGLLLRPWFGVDWWNLDYAPNEESRRSSRYGARVEYERDAPQLGLLAGVDAWRGAYEIQIQDVSLSQDIASADPYITARVGGLARIEPGLRLETLFVSTQRPRLGLSPRLRAQAPVGERLILLADAGIYHQPPPLDLTIAYFEGPYLALERSRGGGAGFVLDLDAVSLQSGGYARTIEAITAFEDDGTLGQGEGYAWGVESMLQWDLNRLGAWVSYTWSRSFRREEPGDVWEPYRFDQPHYLIAVASWRLPRQWVLSGRTRVGSGYPWDPDTDEVFDLLSQVSEPLAPDDYLRLQPYHTADLKLSKQVMFRRWQLDFYLDVQNLYNRRVPEPVITDTIEYNETWYNFGLPTLPIFGVAGQFL